MTRRPWFPWLVATTAVGLAALLLWRPDPVAQRLGFGAQVEARRHALWHGRLHGHHLRLDASTPPGATLFFGASTVQGLNTSTVGACGANFGIGGETSTELLRRLGDYRSPNRAGAIVVMTGLNDVLRDDALALAANYRRLLAMLPPDRPVVLSSLPRLSPATPAGQRGAQAVLRANAAARVACATRPGCHFVDLHGAMSTPAALTERDGIHLNSAGYALWSRLLRASLATAGVTGGPCMGAGGG
jgi:lysophospholipase L1-like esterase